MIAARQNKESQEHASNAQREGATAKQLKAQLTDQTTEVSKFL